MIVRRIGWRPSGATPASAATASAQAPAALTRTGRRDASSTIQASPRRSIAVDALAEADLAALRAHVAGEALEQGVGVELEAGRIEEAAHGRAGAGPEHRAERRQLGRVERADRVGELRHRPPRATPERAAPLSSAK